MGSTKTREDAQKVLRISDRALSVPGCTLYTPLILSPKPNQRYRESPSGLGDFHAHSVRR